MTRLPRTFLLSIPTVILAQSAWADLTAQDVWADWKSYVSGFGYTIEGQEESDDGALTITGVTISTAGETGEGAASISMDKIVMAEQSDGTVAVTLPAIMPVEISALDETGGAMRVSMDYRQTGMTIVASGQPDAMRYAYSADTVTLTTTGMEVGGDPISLSDNGVEVAFDTISGTTDVLVDSVRRYDQSVSVDAVRYQVIASDPETNAKSDLSGQMQDMSFGGESALPLRAVDPEDMNAMLAAGLAANGSFSYAANAMNISVISPADTSEANVISGSGTLSVGMGQDGLTYDVEQNDLEVEMVSNQIPLPLSFTASKSAFNMSIPVQKSDQPESFALGLLLDGLVVADAIWSMFDPTGQLPRDPATVSLDLTGEGKLLFDVLDPGDASALAPGTAPAEIDKLRIEGLNIALLGTELKGTGSFEFDNGAAPIPRPKGAVDLSLTGANALIDKLVSSGLLPDQQAMGARMMMGLLAVPGDTPDSLTSRIEINEQGHVIANGQRIQ